MLSPHRAHHMVYPLSPLLPQEVVELIQACLQVDPWLRPSAAEVFARLQRSGGGGGGAVV